MMEGKSLHQTFCLIINSDMSVYTEKVIRSVVPLQVMSDFCDPMECSPPGFSVHGVFQARALEWVAISFARGSS